jgi:4-hydroxybenzoate polyprenyltransferase
LIRVSRPVTWLCFPAFFGIGFIASHAPFTPLAAVNLVLLVFLAPLIGFGVNDVYDYKADLDDERRMSAEGIKRTLNYHGSGLEPEHHSLILKAALVSTLILIAFSAFTRNLTHLLATAVALAAAWGYSLPPVRLKERPPLDSLSMAVVTGSMALMGFSYVSSMAPFPPQIIFACLAASAVHALGAIEDYATEKKAGVKTIATVFGKRGAALFALAVMSAILLFSGVQSVPLRAVILYFLLSCALLVVRDDERLVGPLLRAGGLIMPVCIFLFLLRV